MAEEIHESKKSWVVGIGASAGGLEALQSFVENLPPKLPACFVIAQHLAPHAKSLLVELLSRRSSLPVRAAASGQIPQNGNIYVVPPNMDITVRDGQLILTEAGEETRPKPSVDSFFESLARAWGDRAVGIVLSGTGTDGSEGIRLIRAQGGLTMAQDDQTARYGGMPRGAVDTGSVDIVMSPDEMAKDFLSLLERHASHEPPEVIAEGPVLKLIKKNLGMDYTQYKPSTIRRRIDKHMRSLRITKMPDYLQHLKEHPSDLQNLSTELLVSVTSFFRDPPAFEALRKELDQVLLAKTQRTEFRTWVAGCATGEEAYSLAILLNEIGRLQNRQWSIRIFATDLDQEALLEARAGIYSREAVEGMPPDLLSRYFIRRNEGYEVAKFLRDSIVFARQDLTQSAPFVKVDLISCRNVMIYFEPALQKRVFEMFHYALNPSGLMFLGRSEAAQEGTSLFSVVDKSARLFRKNSTAKVSPASFRPSSSRSMHTPPEPALDWSELARRETLAKYQAAGAVIDEQLTILHVMGNIADFVRHPEGQPSALLTSILPKMLSAELGVLVRQVKKENKPKHSRSVVSEARGKAVYRLEVRPLPTDGEGPLAFLVLFIRRKVKKTPTMVLPSLDGASANRWAEAEEQLAAAREQLQTLSEELGITNEELQSLNEELSSTNEELQASNEQLETTNEELQSSNEELTTLNEELSTKSSELKTAYTNLENIQNSITSPVIVIDRDLRVIRFNTASTKLFELSPAEVGVALTRVSCRCEIPDFADIIQQVLETGKPSEHIVDGVQSVYQMRVFPSLDEQRRIIGAVLVFLDNTNLIRTEEKLKSSEERIRAIIESFPGPISMKDTLGRYLIVNTAFSEFFQIPVQETIGRTDREIFDPDIARSLRDPDLEVLHRRASLRREVRIKTDDGKEAVLMTSGFPLMEKDKDAPYAVGSVSVDVTKQVRMQEELTRSESRYRAMVEDQAVFVCRLSPERRFLFVNRSFCMHFGGMPESYINLPFDMLVDENDRDRIGREFDRLTPSSAVVQFEQGLLRFGNTRRWILWILRAIFNSDGTLCEYQAVGLDVTEHRNENVVLQARESLLRRIFDHTSDHLAIFKVADEEFFLESFNRSAEKSMGHAFTQLLGRNVRELYNPERAEEIVQRFRDCVQSREPQMTQDELLLPGGVKHLSMTIVPIPDADGRIERIATLSRDISSFKQIERELRQERDRAETANQSKTDFMASMSHELRTPLNIVLGMGHLLMDSDLDDDQRQFVESIQRSGQILLTLIEDILDISKIEEGKVKIEQVPFPLKPLVLGVMEGFVRDAAAKKIVFKSYIAPAADHAFVSDPGRLRQILTNLVGNALKFTDQGSVTLEVTARDGRFPREPEVLFRVIDTGIGIQEKDHHRIFKKFSQVDSGLSRRYGGSGLGLAISQRLVKIMGGEISFESSWGKGTTFWFRLPLQMAENTASPSARHSPPRAALEHQSSLQSLKILAVDDNIDSRLVIELFMKSLGHRGRVAGGGQEAIDLLSTEPFDLVLMDVQMPGLNGYETTRLIRESGNQVPIIALTANAMSGDVDKCLQAGMNDYISKPVDLESLKAMITKWSPEKPEERNEHEH